MSTSKSELTLKLNMQLRRDPGPITVELRGATAPFELIEAVNGTGGGNVASVIRFEKSADGVPYYVVIKGNNLLETWSATAIQFNSGAASYDFTTSISQAFGSNQTLSSDGIPSIYQGDVNQDGSIDLTDIVTVHNEASSFGNTPSTDIDNSGVTDLGDVIVTYNNSSQFVEVKRPS